MNKKYEDNKVNVDNDDIMEEISKSYIKKAKKEKINIELDPKVLKNTLDMDIRENIPPQLLSIVSGVINIIEELEKGEIDEDKKK